jgi:hypothetical protein
VNTNGLTRPDRARWIDGDDGTYTQVSPEALFFLARQNSASEHAAGLRKRDRWRALDACRIMETGVDKIAILRFKPTS